MNDLISVIVPVYNVELFLNECIESIISQTYSNIEIILVDDGSSDSSGKVCDQYEKIDSRIRVIHQKNSGVSAARNHAINLASGQYIAFVDSDDYITPQYLEKLYTLLCENGADIAVCRYYYTFGRKELPKDGRDGVFIYNKLQALRVLLAENEFGHYPHQKLFRADIIKKYLYPEGKIYEDVATTYKHFSEANCIVYSQEQLYAYRQREGSIIAGAYNDKNKFDILDALDEMQSFFDKYYPEIAEYVLIPKMFYYLHTLARLPEDRSMYVEERVRVHQFLAKNRIKALRFSDMPKATKKKIILSLFGERIYRMIWKTQKKRLARKIRIRT